MAAAAQSSSGEVPYDASDEKHQPYQHERAHDRLHGGRELLILHMESMRMMNRLLDEASIEAGIKVLRDYDPEFSSLRETVLSIYSSMDQVQCSSDQVRSRSASTARESSPPTF